DAPYNYQSIKQIVEQFYKQNIVTPGVKPTDLVAAIMQAKTILPESQRLTPSSFKHLHPKTIFL
ncbi:MAG: hypothetical protein Q6366_005630, partial [Candidatus Freyarchaeota archaeon]